jgi:hypothetical protein
MHDDNPLHNENAALRASSTRGETVTHVWETMASSQAQPENTAAVPSIDTP